MRFASSVTLVEEGPNNLDSLTAILPNQIADSYVGERTRGSSQRLNSVKSYQISGRGDRHRAVVREGEELCSFPESFAKQGLRVPISRLLLRGN